jgi:hypothetical protein
MAPLLLSNSQYYVDIVPGCIGIRAYLVGIVDQFLCSGSFDAGQMDRHSNRNAEPFRLSLQGAKGHS